ncbi:MAG: preprotein translocase subunit SecY [Patescibacteria group bacterium]
MDTLRRIWKIKELRNSLFFVLFALTVFRVAAHITVPGVDPEGLADLLGGNQFLGLLNMFSGGSLKQFSIVALGVGPYITSSIIFQLLGMIFPQVEEMQKEEQGRQKINSWTRWATVPLAFIQGFGVIALLNQQGAATGVQIDISGFSLFAALLTMAVGTIFLMWLGEMISERNVGNGISIMILAGIIAGLPAFIQQTVATYTSADLFNIVLFLLLTIVTVITVVVINEGQRNIPVQYARGANGASGKVSSHLPLRVSMGGMIPIIFAIALIVFPPLVAQFFLQARTAFIQNVAQFVLELFGNSLFYAVIYFVLVFAFTYFYASVIFKPETVAENLQKQGGFIPGIRPGEQTAKYLNWVKNRILLTGATFLGLIAILPLIVQEITGSSNLVVGGASILIIVAVVIDMVKQIESQITMRRYDM